MCSINQYKSGVRYLFALMLFAAVFGLQSSGQVGNVPALERNVSLNVKSAETRDVLNQMAAQVDVVFSYSSSAFDPAKHVSVMADGKPVRFVLNTMFQGAVNYKVKGRYIILTANRDFGVSPSLVGGRRTIEGYITEPVTGKKLSGVTIYDRNSMASSTTNEYGYFRLTIPEGYSNTDIKVSKEGYLDLAVNQTKETFNFIVLNLSADSLKQAFGMKNATLKLDSTKIFPEWLIPKSLSINTANLSDTLFRKVQVSFLPYLGTNLLLTGNVENDYSFNVVAGYVQGVRKAEFGAVLNIVRDSVRFVQMAGVGNFVGKGMRGLQAAGVFNKTRRMDGVQLAGVVNAVQEDSRYLQAAGVGNITIGKHTGMQYAGTFNLANEFDGMQAAGTLNYTAKGHGVQAAGVFNQAKRMDGVQLAAVVNYVDTIRGGQISAVVNIANYVKGFQVGLVNIADSVDGVPVGLFSYVRKGYHNIELSCDDIFYGNAAFRTGVPLFHSIMFVGMRPNSDPNPLWTYGLGFGSTLRVKRNFYLDLDVTGQQLLKGDVYLKNSSLYKTYLGVEQKFSKRFAVAAGGTFNFMVYDSEDGSSVQALSTLVPHTIINKPNGKGYIHQTWLGWKVAFRFY